MSLHWPNPIVRLFARVASLPAPPVQAGWKTCVREKAHVDCFQPPSDLRAVRLTASRKACSNTFQ